VLSRISHLQTEQDNNPCDEHPENSQRNQPDNAIDLAVRNELRDILAEPPSRKRPGQSRHRRSPDCSLGVHFRVGQNEIDQKEYNRRKQVRKQSRPHSREVRNALHALQRTVLPRKVEADGNNERPQRQNGPIIDDAMNEPPAPCNVPNVVESLLNLR